MLLGLFVTHIWTGAIFLIPPLVSLISPTLSLSGHPCDSIKIVGTAGTLTGHLWAITLAVITYIGLVKPQGAAIVRAEHVWFGIGLGIYAVAVAVSLGMWALGGETYVGDYCAFGEKELRYSELAILVPRLVVLIVILTIYLRLHIFLRHRRRDVRDSQYTISTETESRELPGYTKEFGSGSRQNASLDTPTALSLDQTTVHDQTVGQGLDEPLHENMADFINRRARMLILLFPLSYTILVVVSLVKLSYNAVHPQQNLILNVVGRWALFLQSGLDALTYGWAGARLKRAVHRLEAQQAVGR
ncbi:hypothetical protein FRC08_012071 [Ceratobasidium sp. 394]|nr:hypothetical protein FRC08_012071 [Ceratobasidium sp. 394]